MARSIESRQTVDQVVLDDIATMTERRLTFIVADAGNPSDVSQWYCMSAVLERCIN